jgi:hypothetical protein
MTDLIACLSSGKGTWGHVSKVIEGMQWNKIYIIGNEFAKDTFKAGSNVEVIVVDEKKTISEMAKHLKESLQGKINDL